MREYLDDMLNKGLASIDTSERVILALTLLTDFVHQRDRLYRFYMARAGPAYCPDRLYWQDYFKANP